MHTITPRQPRHHDPSGALALRLPARPDAVARARGEVGRIGARAGLGEDRLADLCLAVTEACANAVVHAYAGRAPGALTVTAKIVADGLEVAVADGGRGMAPREDSPGLGLGLPLMASLSSAVEVRAAPGGGTEVWMFFAADGPDARLAWSQTG